MDSNPLEKYKEWHQKELDEQFTKEQICYEESTGVILLSVVQSADFWISFCDNYPKYNQDFILNYDGELFANAEPPKFVVKPFSSVINKIYRSNCLNNENFSKNGPPTDRTWVTVKNCYSQFKDIFRITIVVKYIDGVSYIVNKLKEICLEDKNIIGHQIDFEARDEGYYAAHFCVRIKLPECLQKNTLAYIWIEIQITTQLQDVIKKLLHKNYEENRIREYADDWKWKYDSKEFSVNYLGHILHYLEGIIAKIRKNKDKS